MKKTIIAFVAGALLAGVVFAGTETYTILTFAEGASPAQCVEAKGKAAMIAELDADGYVTGEWEPACLVPVK